jgi:hypothetical protein
LDGSGRRCVTREGNNDVSLLFQEFEYVVRSEGGAEAFRLRGEQEDVVVCALAMFEERELGSFW